MHCGKRGEETRFLQCQRLTGKGGRRAPHIMRDGAGGGKENVKLHSGMLTGSDQKISPKLYTFCSYSHEVKFDVHVKKRRHYLR